MTPFTKSARDERIADTSNDRTGMCSAHGCPNRWSIQRESGSGLCSWHDSAEIHHWPIVTEEQRCAEVDRAMRVKSYAPAEPMTSQDKRAVLEQVRAAFSQKSEMSKTWASRLEARERAGERLTKAQRDMWRAVSHGEPS